MTAGVWGYGREGRAAVAWLLRTTSEDVLVFDDRPAAFGAEQPRVRFTADFDELTRCRTCLVSPGVPHTDPRRAQLIAAGVEIRTGTQLWMRKHHEHTVGVTGTKGKSTTSALIHHLLSVSGVDNELAGNIGVPLLDVPDSPGMHYVVELSSYQCQSLDQSPDIGVITQLAWDHVPAHGSVEAYWRAKAKIFTERGRVLVCAQNTLESLHEVGLDTSSVQVHVTEALDEVPADWPAVLTYPHNRANAALGLRVGELLGLRRDALVQAAASFAPLAHRLEEVAETARGLVWITDTLATTQESAIAAVNTFAQHPITLIIGGQDRGQPVDDLAIRLTKLPSVRVICMAQSGERFAAELRRAGVRNVQVVEKLDEAVSLAARISDDHAVVLLSPAAPSYDQFRDFEAKSSALRELVARLPAH
jgi:UDP-N-acetylmuramoylalanine--D-glutamate ligase